MSTTSTTVSEAIMTGDFYFEANGVASSVDGAIPVDFACCGLGRVECRSRAAKFAKPVATALVLTSMWILTVELARAQLRCRRVAWAVLGAIE
eukprot:6175772-Amphidinium_carterae.1